MVNKITTPIDNVGLIEKVNDIIDNTNLGDLKNVAISSPSAGQNLTYDAVNQVWKNTSTTATVAWGGITGTLGDQTDLQNALDDKYDASNPNNYTSVVESTVSGWGFTKNTGTVTSVNNVSPSSGNVTLTADDILPSQASQSGKFLTTNGTTASWGTPSDTLNTAGSTDSSSKLFLIGATSQTTSSQTYSQDTAFVDTNGRLNSSAPASDANDTTVATTKWVKDQGYTTNTGTVTSVNNVSPVNGNVTLSIPTVDQTYNASSTNAQSGVAIAGAKFLKNNSTNTAGTSYIIGGTASSVSNTVCVGSGTSTTAYSVVVGQGASSTALYSTAIGSAADSNSQFGTAIGYTAKARATSAIQLGTGTNTDANTLSIGFSDAGTNYQLLDGSTGLIPDARISSNIARTSAIPTESTVSGWGFTKNAGTVTSVNNVSPVNGNVSLTIPSTDNLANKDLSNLTTTGNAKFQAPLVSGTNIKTINGTSILGSGNVSIDSLPSQASQSGKFLTTNGTTASWANVPSPNDGTLTIQLNGTTVETFSANASANKTANIQATQVIWRKHTT